ncbi:MAG: hypothetical protein U0794_16365 [Isosphaeraceae bacterium]
MTQPETSKPLPESEKASDLAASNTDVEAGETETENEPWTPERVLEWNAYYDLYVMLGVLLLTFIASANKITHSSIWNQLQVGRIIAATGTPVTTDLFSYTEEGKSWVNIPWLFDWSHAFLYKTAAELAPTDSTDPTASAARADQVGAGTLVAIDALARVISALILMRIRKAGPGLWWTAICTTLAMGAVFSPAGIVLGGISGSGVVGPGTWGILLLAIELWLLHRTVYGESPGSIFALVPLFTLWANVDESFLVGLMLLAAFTVGRVQKSTRGETDPLGLPKTIGVLVASILACVLNPSHINVFAAAAGPFFSLFRPATDVQTIDQLSYFGRGIRDSNQAGDAWPLLVTYYLVTVAIGFASFFLNRRNFSLSRFLVYSVAAILWGMFIRFGPEFAVVFAATLALNGQEWYLDRFGSQGRMGATWTLWSVGGRAVTIVLLFALVAKGLTGYGASMGEPQFGFGFDPDDFAFEAAEFLKTAPIQGNVLNTTLVQGDSLVWRAYPERKTYIDSRQHLFPPDLVNRRQEARRALSEDDTEGWKALFDEYKISVVMLDAATSTRTYRVLAQSTHWIPFYDDGNVVMYGRSDASPTDVAFFNANRLDADSLAYRKAKAAPSPERPPSPVTWMDKVFRSRSLAKPQPHTESARRWLTIPTADENDPRLPDPARCLLAIREARAALASKPDDTQAYRLLAAAYKGLMVQEAALLQGIDLTPENAARVNQVGVRPDQLMLRFRQRVTALNYAIQTTPPPSNEAARRELRALNTELFQLWLSVNFVDLARDRLQAIVDGAEPLDFTPEERTQLTQQLAQLNEAVKQIQNQMNDLQNEQQYGPIQLAGYATSQGAPGLAIHELEEAERTGTNPAMVRPQLLDLYCDTGQPDKAVEMLGAGTVEDPAFGREPGVSAFRQGRAYFLMGNSEYAGNLWETYAIPRLRQERVNVAIGSTQAVVRGDSKGSVAAFLELPDKISQQAMWEFDAGLCRLEAGTPDKAAEHFTKALTLVPKFTLRPVVAYYLARLGKPVPALPTEDSSGKASGATTPTTPAPAGSPPDAGSRPGPTPQPGSEKAPSTDAKSKEASEPAKK